MSASRVLAVLAFSVATSAWGAGIAAKQRSAAIRSITETTFGSEIKYKQSFLQSIGRSDVFPCPGFFNRPKPATTPEDYSAGASFCFDVLDAKKGDAKEGRVTCQLAYYRASDAAKERETLEGAGAALGNVIKNRNDLSKAGKPKQTYLAPKTCLIRGNCYFIYAGSWGDNSDSLRGVTDPVVSSTVDCDEDLFKGVLTEGGRGKAGTGKGD